jgi:hypothetical protein
MYNHRGFDQAMKSTARYVTALLIASALSLSGCASAATALAPTASAGVTVVPPSDTPASATPSAEPTEGPTATVWPPVFDPWSLGDIRDLDSFVASVIEENTVNGRVTMVDSTIGYVREPYGAYEVRKYTGGEERVYHVDGRTYTITDSGDWYITVRANDQDVLYEADIPAGNTERLGGAQFAGEEPYEGIPAYHFVLDPAASTPVPGTNSTLEGDFFLAQDGDYVLYAHWKDSASADNSYEVTEALSSINQLPDITLPPEFLPMEEAIKLPQELGLPLPEGSAPSSMVRYRGFGVDSYYFSTPRTSIEEFLDRYRNLPPTEGWTVSHVGHVSLHQDDCEVSRECVILNKGNTQVVLYYDGASLRAEFDWPHLFRPS